MLRSPSPRRFAVLRPFERLPRAGMLSHRSSRMHLLHPGEADEPEPLDDECLPEDEQWTDFLLDDEDEEPLPQEGDFWWDTEEEEDG